MKRNLLPLLSLTALLFLCLSCRREEALPLIGISVEGEIPWDCKTPCALAYITDNDSVRYYAEVKCRGGYSSRYNKHSYAVDFHELVALCGLPAAKAWVLNASYVDKTFMRHKICYDLFRQMAANDIAPLCAYARVSLNGQPNGLYVVMQKLDAQTLKVDMDDTAAVIFKDPPVFYDKQPENGPEQDNYYGQKWPKRKKCDKTDCIVAFRDFLVNASDEEFAESIAAWIDIDNVVDWHLLLLFTDGGDGFLKNFYLYKTDSNTPFRIALWDCDHSFGREGDGEKNWFERGVEWERSVLFSRLMNMPNYRNALKRRWNELRENGVFSYGNIESMAAENDNRIKLGKDENFSIWKCDSPDYYDSATYEEEVALLKEFVKINIQVLDTYFSNL